MSWYNLLSFLSHLCLSPTPSPSPSNSICPHPPAFRHLCSNSEVYSCNYAMSAVSSRTESWGLKLLHYLLCLQGSDTEEKESKPGVTSSLNDKQIDPALWLWQSKQG